MIRSINWNEVEAKYNEADVNVLKYSLKDCLSCVKQGVVNEGYYYDEISIIRQVARKRGIQL